MNRIALSKIAPPSALHRAENDLPFVTFFEGLDFQLLQASVENASVNAIRGEARNTSTDGLVPAQNSMKNTIATKTIALPKSCCSTTRANGPPAITRGMMSCRSVVGGSRKAASQRASIRMTATLASSAGCPRR